MGLNKVGDDGTRVSYGAGPVTKGLGVLVLLAAIVSGAWHFFLKPIMARSEGQTAAVTAQPGVGGLSPAAVAVSVGMGPVNGTAGLGTAARPLKVSIVSFHGYAPALIAAGNSLKSLPGSLFAKHGLNVQFEINDDIPTLTTLFESGGAHCAWRTSDFWAQEHPNLRNAGHDAQAIMVVDNTRGADAIISTDPSIRRIEDLANHETALVQFTPSHGMTIDGLENSSLTARQRGTARFVYIKPEEGTAGVRAALAGGSVKVAALWDPDLSLAMRETGAHVVYSTKTASNLIYDVIVCDQRALSKPENEAAFQALFDGWMEGVEVARANPDTAVDALVATEPLFADLVKSNGREFVKGLFANLQWTGLADNARILGLAGEPNHYERVYRRFDSIYRAEGALANPKSPVISAQESFAYRFVRKALERDAAAAAAAARPAVTYTAAERSVAMAAPAQITKPVDVNFASGSADLSKRAQQIIDRDMVPFIESNGGGYFELSGHTDRVGSDSTNLALSERRARAVRDYLVKQWEISAERFKTSGYGSSRPICDEGNPAAAGVSMDECRALNRTTRLGVFGR